MATSLILMDELFFYFAIFISALIPFAILLILLILMPSQAKKLTKARILKRNTIVLSRGDATLDIVSPKINATGHLKVSKKEIYQPLTSDNPIVTKRYIWKGTGIPVFVADGRKAAYTSPETLTAIEAVESGKDVLPDNLKNWAEEQGLEIEVKTKKDKIETKFVSLLALTPRKLKHYLNKAIDVDAQYNLWDDAYREGMEAVGRQYMKMAIPLIAILGMVAIVLAIIFMAGGML